MESNLAGEIKADIINGNINSIISNTDIDMLLDFGDISRYNNQYYYHTQTPAELIIELADTQSILQLIDKIGINTIDSHQRSIIAIIIKYQKISLLYYVLTHYDIEPESSAITAVTAISGQSSTVISVLWLLIKYGYSVNFYIDKTSNRYTPIAQLLDRNPDIDIDDLAHLCTLDFSLDGLQQFTTRQDIWELLLDYKVSFKYYPGDDHFKPFDSLYNALIDCNFTPAFIEKLLALGIMRAEDPNIEYHRIPQYSYYYALAINSKYSSADKLVIGRLLDKYGANLYTRDDTNILLVILQSLAMVHGRNNRELFRFLATKINPRQMDTNNNKSLIELLRFVV